MTSLQPLFSDSKLLDYLASYLSEVAGHYLNLLSVRRELAGLVKLGLLQIGEAGLRQYRKKVRDIVSNLDPDNCFKVENDLPVELLNNLLSADTETLLLPALFYPKSFGNTFNLSQSDAFHLLQKVEETLGEQGDFKHGLQKET